VFSNEQPAPARASDTGESRPLEVSQLNRQVRLALERGYRDVWVQGELSDVTLASSGHAYFTLNDSREAAQVRCVMFRADLRRAPIKLEDGQMVQVRGSLSLYEPRGSFQLIVRSAVPGGQGDLHAEFERIKKRLMADGLLDPRAQASAAAPSIGGGRGNERVGRRAS
jgi:exodeoxyribonuclease VII large subunit